MEVRARLRANADMPPRPTALAYTPFPSAPDRGTKRVAPEAAVEPAREDTRLAGESLPAPLRLLAGALAPRELIVDCGGGGRCGPNSLAYCARNITVGPAALDGDQLRRAVCAHARFLISAQREWSSEPNAPPLTTRHMIEASMATWAPRGMASTAEGWVRRMVSPTTWVDQAFLALAADWLEVTVRYYAVTADGTFSHTGVIQPSGPTSTRCEMRGQLAVALIIDQHYCAVVPAEGASSMLASPQSWTAGPTLNEVDDVAAVWIIYRVVGSTPFPAERLRTYNS